MIRDIYEIDDKLERAMQLCREELPSKNYSSIRRYIEYCRARRIRPVGLLKARMIMQQSCGCTTNSRFATKNPRRS